MHHLKCLLENFLLLFGSHFPAESNPVEADTEEAGPGFVGVQVCGPGHAGDHPHVTLALVPGQAGNLSTGDIVDIDVSVVLSHRHHPAAADADFVYLKINKYQPRSFCGLTRPGPTGESVWMLVSGALMFLRSQTLTVLSSDPDTMCSVLEKAAQVTLSV